MKTIEATVSEKLELLSKSSNFVGKKDVVYPSAKSLIDVFGEVEIVKLPSANKLNENEKTLYTYPRFILENKLYDDELEGFYGTVGMLVNYQSNKLHIYTGANAKACLNLSIFGADYVKEYDLLSTLDVLPELLDKSVVFLKQHLQIIEEKKTKLESVQYDSKHWENLKGNLISRMDLSLFPYLKHAETLIRDKDEKYLDMPHSDWKMLSLMTDLISKQGVTSRVTKTLELEALFV